VAQGLTELLRRAGFKELRESNNYSVMIRSESQHVFYKDGRYNSKPWPSVKVITLDSGRDEKTIRLYHLSAAEVFRAAKGAAISLEEHPRETSRTSRILFYLQSLANEVERS